MSGPSLLLAWIADHGTTLHAFALSIDEDPNTIVRLVEGKTKHIRLELVAKIEKRTGIKVKEWVKT